MSTDDLTDERATQPGRLVHLTGDERALLHRGLQRLLVEGLDTPDLLLAQSLQRRLQ